jgi:hypothetical protein
MTIPSNRGQEPSEMNYSLAGVCTATATASWQAVLFARHVELQAIRFPSPPRSFSEEQNHNDQTREPK